MNRKTSKMNCQLIKSIEDEQDVIAKRDQKIVLEMIDYMMISTQIFTCAIGLLGLYVAFTY